MRLRELHQCKCDHWLIITTQKTRSPHTHNAQTTPFSHTHKKYTDTYTHSKTLAQTRNRLTLVEVTVLVVVVVMVLVVVAVMSAVGTVVLGSGGGSAHGVHDDSVRTKTIGQVQTYFQHTFSHPINIHPSIHPSICLVNTLHSSNQQSIHASNIDPLIQPMFI